MKSIYLSRFTPSSMSPETLEAIFVQRHWLANDLIDLEELKLDEAVNLLTQIAKLENDRDLESFIRSPDGKDRIRAIHHLAGGNYTRINIRNG